MTAIQPLLDATVGRAQGNLRKALKTGKLHLHLRTNSRGNQAAWWVAFHKTALCGTDRCLVVVKKVKK